MSNPYVRLCETSGLPMNDEKRYVALSHCWGGLEFLTLTRDNYSALRKEIPVDRLTKTFKDAVDLARGLEIRYLWIDSLCIIQRDAGDWQREASRMLDVYRNSYCTIAATGSVNGLRGLFYPRDRPVVNPVYIKASETAQKGKSTVSSSPNIDVAVSAFGTDTFLIVDMDIWTDGVSNSPLGSRAWCLQERVISPRVIHFGERQLYFECQKLQVCPSFPDGILAEAIPTKETKTNFSLHPMHLPADSEARKWHVLHTWMNLVKTYASCNLTVHTDKLVAVGGLAAYLAESVPAFKYYAGIWDHKPLEQLLWYVVGFDPHMGPPFRPKEYQAPTWSWASMNSPIQFEHDFNNEHPLVDIVFFRVKNRSPDPFGQVEKGSLRFQGLLLPGKVCLWYVNEGIPDTPMGYCI
jgi:hypothetical protein